MLLAIMSKDGVSGKGTIAVAVATVLDRLPRQAWPNTQQKILRPASESSYCRRCNWEGPTRAYRNTPSSPISVAGRLPGMYKLVFVGIGSMPAEEDKCDEQPRGELGVVWAEERRDDDPRCGGDPPCEARD